MAAVEDFVARVAGGEGGVLFIEGEPGSGKTHALDHLDEEARTSGVRVLYAQCSRREAAEPWGVVRQLLDFSLQENLAESAPDTLHQLEAELAGIAASRRPRTDSVYDLVSCVHAFFVRLSSTMPTVVAVDGVPHSDAESLRVLAFIAQRAHRVGLGVAVTAGLEGTAVGPEALSDLYWTKTARVHTLGPLGEEEAEEISRQVLGRTSPALTSLCTQLCGGNPLFYRELMRALHKEGGDLDLVRRGGPERLDLRSLARYVADRVEEQAPGAQRLLMSLAVLGPVGPELLLAASGMEPGQGENVLAHLIRTGTVKEGGHLRFAQPVIEHGFRQIADGGLTQEVHAECARRLFEAREPHTRVARHLLQARPEGDQAVVTALRRAAREAVLGQDTHAARLFLERALGEGCSGTAAARAVTRDLGGLLLEHWPDEATDVLRRAHGAERRPAHRAALACALAESVSWSKGPREGLRILRQAQASSRRPAAARIIRSRRRLIEWPEEPGSEQVPNGTVSRREASSPSTEETPSVGAAVEQAMAGERDSALVSARAVLSGGRPCHNNPGTPPHSVFAVLPLIWADRTEEAEVALKNASGNLSAGRGPLSCWTAALESGIALNRGRVEESARSAELALTRLPVEPFGWSDWLLRFHLLQALLTAGEFDAVREQLDRLPPAAASTWASAVRGQIEGGLSAFSGYYGEAARALSASGCVLERMRVSNPAVTQWKSWTALLLTECGQIRSAVRMSESASEVALRWGTPRSIGRARITMGYVLQRDGAPPHQYQGLVKDGLALLEQCSDPVSRAIGFLVAALSAQKDRDPRVVRERLAACSRLARSAGARSLDDHANMRLRELGDTATAPETAAASISLTDSERRIAETVVSGLTNRQTADQLFVTLRTVEFHLTNIYRKLAISGRDELREALHHCGKRGIR